MEKLEEAKELLAQLEDVKDVELGGARGTLMRAGESVSAQQAYMRHMQKAAGRIAGLAIEAGQDEIASEAAALIADLDDFESASD